MIKKNIHQMKELIAIKVNNGVKNLLMEFFFHIIKTTIHQTTPKDHPTNKLEIDQ